jgi:hypothetical protein
VFLGTDDWSAPVMRVTQEMKQFESIFLSRSSRIAPGSCLYSGRRGPRPLVTRFLAEAAVLHRTQSRWADANSWVLKPPPKRRSGTKKIGSHHLAECESGGAIFCGADASA